MKILFIYLLAAFLNISVAKAGSYDDYRRAINDLESLEVCYIQPIWDNEKGSISFESMRLFLENNWQKEETFIYNWNRLVSLWNSYASHFIY